MDKISLKSINSATKREKNSLETLKDLEIPDDYIAWLIIPSFSQKTQSPKDKDSEYLDAQFFMRLMNEPKELSRWENYQKSLGKIAKMIDEVKSDLNRFFVCQQYTDGPFLNDLAVTFQLMENCETFPREYQKAMPKLWYSRKSNGHIDLITPPEDFVALCQNREAKLNVLFLHAQDSTWLKNFLAGYEKKILHVLPDIHLLLIKVK